MKESKYIYGLALFLAVVITGASCKKDMTDNSPLAYNLSNKAHIQWFNATVNSSRNYIYVNGQAVNGATVAFGTVFPSSAYSFAIYSGTNGITIKDTAAVTTQLPMNFVHDFRPGKSYTIFTYDLATAPKRLIVENTNVVYPQENIAKVRFINLVYNAPTTIDIFSTALNKKIFNNMQVAAISEFITVQPNMTDKWYVRLAGSTTNIDSLSISTTTLSPRRSYTAVYRGNYSTASTRALNLFANY